MKKQSAENMRMHNKRLKAFQEYYQLTEGEAKTAIHTMDTYLTRGYTDVVVLAYKNEMDINSQIVRHIKNGSTKNVVIFNCLLEMAIERMTYGVAARVKVRNITN